jgi:hypothetical protein
MQNDSRLGRGFTIPRNAGSELLHPMPRNPLPGGALNVFQKCRDGAKKFIWLVVHAPFQPVLEKSKEIEI